MSDIFLSYARIDKDRVKPLAEALERSGWTVWWDPTILPGQVWDQVIEDALDAAKCVIVAWSATSVRSTWVRNEAAEGNRRGVLVPLLLDSVVVPLAFRHRQTANFADWRGQMPHAGFEELARALKAILGSGVQPGPQDIPAASGVKSISAVPRPGEVRVNPNDRLPYVWIPPGKFVMGCSPKDSECYDDEKPPHEVTISRGFWMGQTPVTQAAYKAVLGKDPSDFKGDDLPVESVSWTDAKAYCEAVGMRLPTEAEWEYAARAGNSSSRYGDLDTIAWHHGNSGDKTHAVGQKMPNAWGLYDMLGNVWEWVGDWYEPYAAGALVDPTGPAKGALRVVLRGGSWGNDPRLVRVSVRDRYVPAFRSDVIGFRCGGELP